MQVKNIAECSKGSILQYFRPSLSYQLFILYLSGRFTQVLLYCYKKVVSLECSEKENMKAHQAIHFCAKRLDMWKRNSY